MKIRYRLADWISGGALSRAKEGRIEALKSMNRMERAREAELKREVQSWSVVMNALRRIEKEERPTSNATVRRMARIAREALSQTSP